MRKTHYIPITADVPGAANDANCALIRRTIRTALAAEGLTAPCEVDVLSGRYVIDAKSIMGLFSLDLSHPVKVEVHGSDADRSAFEQSVAAFEVKQTQ